MCGAKSRFGISTCIVAWCAMASVVWAQAVPRVPTVEIEVAGHPAGAVRLLTWEGDRPSVIELVSADGTGAVRKVIDPNQWESMVYAAGYPMHDGWSTGSLSVPTAARPLVYEARSRAITGGQIEVVINPEGELGDSIRALVPERGLPGDTVGPENAVIVVIILFLACVDKQAEAVKGCAQSAGNSCGAGNVHHMEYTGTCGVGGACHFSCK